ncbi:MAG TPA: transglutaminase domain-containing protein [Terriglobales bacterium]|nr:transglutaminase domain-containing protein [Terriglobales bacterium]
MKTARLFFALSVLPLLFSLRSFADWPPISPDDLKMTDLKEQPGASAVVLDREEIDDDMNNAHSVYERIKILTDAGREYANVEIPYSRRGFSVAAISGQTVHVDGTVIPFAGKPLDKTVVKGGGIRVNVKSFTLPDVQVGSVIDFRYTLRYDDNLLLPPTWEVQTDLFQRKAYFKFIPFQNHGSMYIQLAHGQISNGLAWTPFLGDGPQPQKHELPTQSFATVHDVGFWVDLTRTNIPALVEEPFMPPKSILRMRVYFYYQEKLNQDDYWKAEGKLWNKDVEEFLGRNHGIDEAVAKITSPADTPEQKVRKLYAFIGNLENLDYVPERSQQENKTLQLKLVKGSDDVLTNRSGDHDQLNRLFVSMVRAAGIPASLMLVPDRERDIFVKQLLSMSQFDAEVAIVQLAGKDVFLDPGTKYCPYGILDWRYTGVEGLRQSPKGAEIAQTTPPIYTQSVTTRLARIALDEQGTASGTVTLMFKGSAAMQRRQEGGRTDAEGRKKFLEDEARGILPGNSEISLTNSPDWDSPETALIAQFHVRFPFAVAAGKRLMIAQHVFQVNDKPRFPSTDRKNAVYFHLPWLEADEVHITIPAGMEVESLAPDDMLKLEYAVYKVVQKKETPDTIFSRRDFIMGQGVFTPQDYKQIKGFFDKVKADDDQPALVRLSQSVATAK